MIEAAGVILTGLAVLYLVYRVGLAVGSEPSSDDMLVEHFRRHGRYFPECEHGEWFCRGMRYMTEHGCYELTPEGWKLMGELAPCQPAERPMATGPIERHSMRQ